MEQQGINPPFIVTDGLTKTYIRREKPENGGITRLWRRETREVQALRDVSFRIGRGELVGLIGPNGAGKSTLVKLMTGILTPTSGSCTVDGRTPWAERKAHVRSLGAVFGQRMQLWWDVPIRDSFDLLRDIYSIDEGRYRHRLDELTTALDLGDIMQSPLRQLSLGQRMRAELCGSLLHEPELLFLDEPTIGRSEQIEAAGVPAGGKRDAPDDDFADDARHGGHARAVQPSDGAGTRPAAL